MEHCQILGLQDITINSPDPMPTISHAHLNSPYTAIKEVPIVTELLSEITESQLVTKTQSEVAEATTEPWPGAIECQLEITDGEVAHDSNAGEGDIESNGEIEEEDEDEDEADVQTEKVQ